MNISQRSWHHSFHIHVFLVISQDSFFIPSIQDSYLKKQILTFRQGSCRLNLGWRGKKCLARQDSCVFEFLSDSSFSSNSCLTLVFLNSCMILVIKINPLYISIQLSRFVTVIFLLRISNKIHKKVKDKCNKKIHWVHITYFKKRKKFNTEWKKTVRIFLIHSSSTKFL